jgi:hypothetical protein
MAKAHGSNGKLEDALTRLLQAQAALSETRVVFNQTQAAFNQSLQSLSARMAETDRINAERFARIEAILLDHSRILEAHTRILRDLPDAVRDKFGFQPPETAKAKP